MRPGPRNPGESVADYNTRVKAMEAKWKAGMGGPKSGGTKGGAAAAAPGPKTPAQLAREAESRRIGIARGSIVTPRTPVTAAQRQAEKDRLMKIRGSDMPKAKPSGGKPKMR